MGYTPDVFGANERKVESLDAQARDSTLRARGDLHYSRVECRRRGDSRSRDAGADGAAVKEIIDYSEKSLDILRDKFVNWAMRCVSMWRQRRRRWPRLRHCCLLCRSNLSKLVI